MSNSLDPDQARHFVGPDLDPNCLQMLSADDTSRQRVKPGTNREVIPVKKSFSYFIQIPIPWPARIRIHRFRVQEPFYAYRSTELAYIILTDAQAFPKPGCHKIIMWLIRLFSTGLSHCELENRTSGFLSLSTSKRPGDPNQPAQLHSLPSHNLGNFACAR